MPPETETTTCPHPTGSWRTPHGGCYVCWCETQIRQLRADNTRLQAIVDSYQLDSHNQLS